MYGLDINLVFNGVDNEYARTTHPLEEDLSYGVGWGWLTTDILPTCEMASSSDACDLRLMNPMWNGIANASKINAACVTPGYFLDRVEIARSDLYNNDLLAYRVTRKNGWLILSTQGLYAEWFDDYVTPAPSKAKMADAINAVIKAYGSITAAKVFGKAAIAEYWNKSALSKT